MDSNRRLLNHESLIVFKLYSWTCYWYYLILIASVFWDSLSLLKWHKWYSYFRLRWYNCFTFFLLNSILKWWKRNTCFRIFSTCRFGKGCGHKNNQSTIYEYLLLCMWLVLNLDELVLSHKIGNKKFYFSEWNFQWKCTVSKDEGKKKWLRFWFLRQGSQAGKYSHRSEEIILKSFLFSETCPSNPAGFFMPTQETCHQFERFKYVKGTSINPFLRFWNKQYFKSFSIFLEKSGVWDATPSKSHL